MIINLTSNERWKLGIGYNHGRTINFHDQRDQRLMQTLITRGLVEAVQEYGRPSITRANLTDLGKGALEYLESMKTVEEALWTPLLAFVEELKEAHPDAGNMRGAAEYTHSEDGRSEARSTFTTFNTDGTQTHYAITTTQVEEQITTSVQITEDTRDTVWGPDGEMDQDDAKQSRIIVDHTFYTIKPDTTGPSHCAGFGGHAFEIEYLTDGRRVTSRNLWHGPTVPPKWRERWPDTARFIPPPPRPSLAEQLGLKQK